MHGWIGCLSRKLLLCYKIKICLAAASVLSRILPFPIQYKTENENQWTIFLISITFLCFFNFNPSCSRGAQEGRKHNEKVTKENAKTAIKNLHICLSFRDLK